MPKLCPCKDCTANRLISGRAHIRSRIGQTYDEYRAVGGRYSFDAWRERYTR